MGRVHAQKQQMITGSQLPMGDCHTFQIGLVFMQSRCSRHPWALGHLRVSSGPLGYCVAQCISSRPVVVILSCSTMDLIRGNVHLYRTNMYASKDMTALGRNRGKASECNRRVGRRRRMSRGHSASAISRPSHA